LAASWVLPKKESADSAMLIGRIDYPEIGNKGDRFIYSPNFDQVNDAGAWKINPSPFIDTNWNHTIPSGLIRCLDLADEDQGVIKTGL